jgi:YVTN family beta-propeller protein
MWKSQHRSGRPRWRPTLKNGVAAACLLLLAAAPVADAELLGRSSDASGTRIEAMQPAGAPKAYVGLFKDNAVAVLDTDSRQVLRTIPVPAGPHGLVITPDGAKVFVSSDGASTVSVIDTATDQVVDSIDVGQTPHGLAISPDGRQVLVSGFGANQAEIIDTGSDQIVGRVPVPQPHNSAISPDGRRAYVGSQQQGETALVAVDLTSMTRTGIVPLDKTPRALSFSPDGRWVYFTLAGSDAVQVLDASRNEVVAQIPVGVSPHLPTFTPDGQLGLVVAQGPGELDLIDPGTNTESAAITVGAAPHWLTTSADGRTAYVTNENSNDVSIVDLGSRQVVASVPIGNAPRKIAVQPGMAMMAAHGEAPAGMATDSMPMTPAAQAGAQAGAPSGAQPGAAPAMRFNDHGTVDVRGKDEIDVEADDDYFEPTFLRGAPGQTLKLVVENESSSLHNMSIPGLGVDTNVPPHASAEIEVTFPQSGSMPFFCKLHTALGMNGALLVGDATP